MLRLEALVIAQGEFRLEAELTVPRGARVAVLGPSGAGKSTLLAAIAGFLRPASGRILWDGADIGRMAPGARPLSLVFQDNNLFPHLDVAANVGLGLRPDLRLSTDQRAEVEGVLAQCGLAGLGSRLPAALSGGQQSRVVLARALLRRRPLLMLDEPFGALGPALRAEMLDLVADVLDSTGATLLMVTHDPADATRIADSAIVVAEGRAAAPAPLAALLADPPPTLAAYLGTPTR